MANLLVGNGQVFGNRHALLDMSLTGPFDALKDAEGYTYLLDAAYAALQRDVLRTWLGKAIAYRHECDTQRRS